MSRATSHRKSIILVIDDNRQMRMLVRKSLENAGHRVEVAEDGTQGLRMFKKLLPDLVLLDVAMPGMDGYEVCRKIRKRPDSVNRPIVMLTGADDRDSIKNAYESGATDYFAKSTNWALLPYRVQYILRASETLKDLKQSEDRLFDAQRLAHIGNWHWEFETGEIHWSAEVFRIYGVDPDETQVTYKYFSSLVQEKDRERVQEIIQSAVKKKTAYNVVHRIVRPDGEERIIEQNGEVVLNNRKVAIGIHGSLQDVTEKKLAERRIRSLAYFDTLTKLGNRQLFKQRLESALSIGRRRKNHVGVLFFDLDQFKQVNDSLGHAAGDSLLKQVATRMQDAVRDSDYVANNRGNAQLARLGGDEFTVLLADLESAEDIVTVAHRVIEKLNEPFTVLKREIFATASIGIAVFPEDGEDANTLLTHADVAMYQAKSDGGNCFRFYADSMGERIKKTLEITNKLRRAVQQGKLSLYYQPQIDLESGHLTAVEALIRWEDQDLGSIPPEEFIPLAEKSSQINAIGEWVMHEACQQVVKWQEQGRPAIRVAVNISAHQLRTGNLPEVVHRVLQDTGVDPKYLELELTESALMENVEESISELEAIKGLGVRLSIDDFGTGYSSLSYLSRFPLDLLKVDRSFVHAASDNQRDTVLISSIVKMAKNLGFEVIAEGLETEDHVGFVQSLDCEIGQGFFIAKPMPVADLEAMMEEQFLKECI